MAEDTSNPDSVSKPGLRKNGAPFADGNTREDGSYAVGKYRTPEGTRFVKGDGRPRGRRPKGTRNLATDWDEELAEKMALTEDGTRKRVSKQRGVVKAVTARAVKGSDRAAEIVLRYAAARDDKAGEAKLRIGDSELIRLYLEQHAGKAGSNISDDHDTPATIQSSDDDAHQ